MVDRVLDPSPPPSSPQAGVNLGSTWGQPRVNLTTGRGHVVAPASSTNVAAVAVFLAPPPPAINDARTLRQRGPDDDEETRRNKRPRAAEE